MATDAWSSEGFWNSNKELLEQTPTQNFANHHTRFDPVYKTGQHDDRHSFFDIRLLPHQLGTVPGRPIERSVQCILRQQRRAKKLTKEKSPATMQPLHVKTTLIPIQDRQGLPHLSA